MQVAGSYEAEWLWHDLLAGLVLTAVLIPVGIAYAVASGVPAVCGLYATIVGLLAYAVFGPSRILVLGPDSSLVTLVLAVTLPLSRGDPGRAMALAGMMALVSGTFCTIAGLAKLGFITDLLSKPIRYGYMNGIALTVLVSQLPAMLGVPVADEGLFKESAALLRAVMSGRINWVALSLGAGTLATVLVLRRSRYLPGALVAVVCATIAVATLDLAAGAGVAVLGPLPRGLPAIAFPLVASGDFAAVLMGGVAVALVSFADTSVLSRAYAARSASTVDPNREMVGLGAANMAVSLFQGLPISGSASRTPVAAAAGAKTQLTGVVGAVAVATLIMLAPDLLKSLPAATLAAVVIGSAVSLVEIADLLRIFRVQRWEFWLSVTCTIGVAVFGAVPGIGLAVGIAVLEFLWDGWRPHYAVLGRVPNLKGYHDVTRYPDARVEPGLVLFRWDAPLFFANAELFRSRVIDAIANSPTPVVWFVVTAEPVTSIDVTAADVLSELEETLSAARIELCFAELKDPVKDKLKRFGLFARVGEGRFFPTVGEAVGGYLRDHPAPIPSG